MTEQTDPVKILIVDDSVVMRTLLRSVVMTDARLEVVGTAIHGEAALRSMENLKPDLILLDVEMPVMDGLSTLRAMRERGLRVPVIMCSTLTQRGAQVTIEALAAGAVDYVAKPSGQSSRDASIASLAHDLVPKILALTRRSLLQAAPQSPVTRTFSHAILVEQTKSRRTIPDHEFILDSIAPQVPRVVAIGVSTGGPAALDVVLPALPQDFPLPVLVVQHMPELFTRLLAERLDGRCALRVSEAQEGMAVESGHIYVAKGNWHMEVHGENRQGRASLRLTQAEPENHCRPAADVLFRSAVTAYGGAVLGVVMTGMGADGLAGCRHIRAQGGCVFAQDQTTSAVWGMPGAVVQAGLAHKVLPLNALAKEIVDSVRLAANKAGGDSAMNLQQRAV